MLYFSAVIIGYIIGSKLRNKREKITYIGKIQTFSIIILVFVMGLRMGSNKEVIGNIKTIGLSAFVMTIVTIGFSILAIFATRKLMGMNRYGELKSNVSVDYVVDNKNQDDSHKNIEIMKMTLYILIFVTAGMLVGYFYVNKVFESYSEFDKLAGIVIKVGLCMLLMFVGVDLGLEGTVISKFKKVGLRVLVFPIVSIVGSLLGGLVCSLFLPVTVRESLAISAGFGWYTFAPGIIMDAGFVKASAISFMHNVMREMFSILTIPLVAKYIGYLETTGMPGAAAMDVCLPIVEKSTSSDIAVYSFVMGVVLTAVVPVLVPLIIG